MTEHETESGVEVVLDNRKIILAFVVLIAICGGFFVLGFIEGKRQGYQSGMQTSAEVGTTGDAAVAQAPLSDAETVQDSASPKNETEDQPLNWYKNVNRQEEEPEIASRETTGSSNKPKAAAAKSAAAKAASEPKSSSKPKTETSSLRTGSISYSVQVGAFVKQEEAEIRARELRSKGYDYRIEPPAPPNQFYFVKVGTFGTRAEAVAMQLRLKESGFSCFIKTN